MIMIMIIIVIELETRLFRPGKIEAAIRYFAIPIMQYVLFFFFLFVFFFE